MEYRQYGEYTTLETRAEANEKVNRQARYNQITAVLTDHICEPMTAKEIAQEMYKKGQIPTNERNFVAPRATELCKAGIIEPVGKKICKWTGKKVTAYALREVM